MNWPIRNPNADWTEWLPDGESQINGQISHDFDEVDCLSFKRVHAIETAIYQLTGLKIKYSVRYLAYWSKTVEGQGAYEANVDAAMRAYGLALENDWPLTNTGDWSDWATEPPSDVVSKGQRFNQFWSFQSIPIIASEVPLALKTGPVEVIMTIDGTENHGVMIYKQGWYFDSYPPFQKQFTSADSIDDYYLSLITPMPNTYVKIMNYNGTVGLFMPLDSENPAEINLLNNLYNTQITVNPDGTIPAQVTTVDKV